MFNLAIMRKVDKEEFNKVISTFSLDDEKMKKSFKDIEDLYKKLDQIQELWDKKIKQFKKDIDVSIILKQLKNKAEEDEVQKGFLNVDSKLAAVSDIISNIKKEYDQMSNSFKSMKLQMMKQSDNTLVSTKHMNPHNCLSCGRGDSHLIPPVHSVNFLELWFINIRFRSKEVMGNFIEQMSNWIRAG